MVRAATPRSGAGVANGRSSEQIVVVAAPLRKQVYSLLREAILTFQYEPGQRLIERELCDRYGVSRTVIREALRHLEADGMVELLSNRGPAVSTVSADEASAIFEIREKVESIAARYFCERATPRQRKRLNVALGRVETAYRSGRLVDELHAKDAFYSVLFEGCGNQVIVSTLLALQNRAQMLRPISLRAPGRSEEAVTELREMVNAMDREDAAAAERAAADHVRKAGAVVLKSLSAVRDGVPADPG